MKKCILLFIGAILYSIGSFADTNLSSHFTVNTTLTEANSPYVVTNNINVNAGVTVTVEKNVVIKFNGGTYLRSYGTLNAKGATFTSSSATPTKGIWSSLRVEASGSNTGTIYLDSCTVEYASYLYDYNGQITLKKCILNNFSEPGVYIYPNGTLNIEETTIKNTSYPIYFNENGAPGKLIAGINNQLTGNTNDYIYLYFNNIPGTLNLPNLGIPYQCRNSLTVTDAGVLNISPGVQLKLSNGDLTVNGKIKAIGTIEKPIVFDKWGGASYWYGININDNSIDTACIFKNCIFQNANNNDYEPYVAVEINTASPTFEKCRFTGNYRNLVVTGISKPTFTNCYFGASTLVSSECYNIGIDMNANLDFTTDSIVFNAKEIRAVKIRASTSVTGNAQLKKLSFKNLVNPTYCLYGTTTVNETASLVINPGVVIKCRNNSAMIVANGTLTGIGTDTEPIVFTHIADDNFGNPNDSQNDGNVVPNNSNSGRIAIYGATTSQIKNWKIHYGGYGSSDWAVYVSKGNIVENCEIKNSYRGVNFYDNAQILNNSFININNFPVGRTINQGNPVLLGNTVANVGTLGILITGFGNDSPTLKSFDFGGITNAAYVVESNLAIASGNVVTIVPGVVIKFQSNTNGYLTVNGALKAIGKESNKIIFTSINDDSAGGDTNNNGTASVPSTQDWQGLDFTGTASDTENILKNCEIRYSGYYYFYASVRITDCRVVMDSTKINFGYHGALAIFGTANPEITNSQFYNLNEAPIYMDMFSNPTFAGNKVANLPRIGLRIRGGSISGTIPVRSFAGYDTITYIIEETMTVNSQLTIPAGLTFKTGNSGGRWNIYGKLDIQGTAESCVVFTSQEDDLYGNPKDMQQNGQLGLNNYGSFFVFYDASNDNSTIDHALFRYSYSDPVQMVNASPKILNSTFENLAYEGLNLSGSSTPSINGCTFNNIPFPFTTSLVTYPAETTGNTISGTTGRAIRVSDETLTQNVTLVKHDFAGITNIPYFFQNYTVGTGAKLTISPGLVCKFGQNGYLNIQNGLIAKGGSTVDSTIVFTADRDDFYGGDTYKDGDANLPNNQYWKGINFYNESIDENCLLENCILKDGTYWYYPYYSGYESSNYGAVTLNNASPTIKNCLFESNYFGIISRGTSLPKITNCDFVGTDPTYGYGIWNQNTTNTVTAEGCWWNHNTGPKNAISNPGGQGERVSNYVDFDPWALQLSKPVLGDVSMNGEVKPYDASLVLQHSVAAIVLTPKQQGVADVSGNGIISSYDASLILQYSVGLISRFDPEPLNPKSASISQYASISFPDLISEPVKKTFEIPLTVSTSKGIKALDMKYSINQNHVKFIRLNKDKLPAGISIETGFNSKTGEILISIASAYDLNLINQLLVLEFEFNNNSGISQSQFDLTNAMANDHILTDMGYATISSKTGVTGADYQSRLTEPVVYTDQYAIHAKYELSKSNQDLFIQVVDVTGRILYKRTLKNLSSGLQYFDLLYTDFDRPNKGIYILNLRTDDFSYSKKLLIK